MSRKNLHSKKNVRQEMLKEAKKIANAKSELREERVIKTLNLHSEFDSGEFRKMVIEFQQKAHDRSTI